MPTIEIRRRCGVRFRPTTARKLCYERLGCLRSSDDPENGLPRAMDQRDGVEFDIDMHGAINFYLEL